MLIVPLIFLSLLEETLMAVVRYEAAACANVLFFHILVFVFLSEETASLKSLSLIWWFSGTPVLVPAGSVEVGTEPSTKKYCSPQMLVLSFLLAMPLIEESGASGFQFATLCQRFRFHANFRPKELHLLPQYYPLPSTDRSPQLSNVRFLGTLPNEVVPSCPRSFTFSRSTIFCRQRTALPGPRCPTHLPPFLYKGLASSLHITSFLSLCLVSVKKFWQVRSFSAEIFLFQ